MRLDECAVLGAKTPAHLGDDHPNAAVGNLQRPGDPVADVERPLGRGPNRDPAVRFQTRGRRVRLHIGLVEKGNAVFGFDHHVRLGKPLVHIPFHQFVPSADVAQQPPVVSFHLARRRAQTRLGRVRIHGRHRVDYRRQHLVVDLDQLQRVLSHIRIFRSYCSHLLPLVAYLVVRKEIQFGNIHRAQHLHHARQGPRLAGVDPADARVWMRAVQDAAIEHVRQVHIVGVLRPAGRNRQPIDLGGALSDALQFLLLCHLFLSFVDLQAIDPQGEDPLYRVIPKKTTVVQI